VFPLSSALLNQIISGYRVEKLLGRGGTGMVFLGVRVDNPDDRVAIKILAPAWSIADDEMDDLRRRFLREFDTYQRLRHKHIVPIRAFGQTITDDNITLSYMILPYLEGGTLTELMTKEMLPLPTVARYLGDLADAIDYAHGKGVVHRDIKPANVLLNAKGEVFLSDFGIAHLFEQQQRTLTASGQVIGTPEYMSPEQASGKEVGPQSDQYSLGIMAFEMATGRVPFQGPTIIDYLKQHSQTPPPALKELRADVPEPTAVAIAKALAKQPEARFSSAMAFARAFDEGLQGRYVPETAPETDLTVHGFTPSKTVSVKTDETTDAEARITPPKTVRVELPKEDAEQEAHPQRTPQEDFQLFLQSFQDLGTRAVAFVRGHVLPSAIVAGVVVVALIAIIIARLPHPTPQTVTVNYSAANPGQCDSSPKNWSKTSNAQEQCPGTGGLLLTDPAAVNTVEEADFAWASHAFPTNYIVAVDAINLTNACAGFGVRRQNFQGYGFYICPDGSVYIEKYDVNGNPHELLTNKATPNAVYHLSATAKGSKFTFVVNGQSFTATDGDFTTTQDVALAVYQVQNGQDASTTFSNFVYTPLH
jgi:serine/threonine protein kinase